jgi:hypothetical protein
MFILLIDVDDDTRSVVFNDLSLHDNIISDKRVSHASTNHAAPARRCPFFGVNIIGVYSQLFIYSNMSSSLSSLDIVSLLIFS